MSMMAELRRKAAVDRRDKIEALTREIAILAAKEYCVAHNEGTYGGAEAIRKCGTAEPYFANRHEYETVGGAKRATGPEGDRMPGRLQRCRPEGLAADRATLAGLRKERHLLILAARDDELTR